MISVSHNLDGQRSEEVDEVSATTCMRRWEKLIKKFTEESNQSRLSKEGMFLRPGSLLALTNTYRVNRYTSCVKRTKEGMFYTSSMSHWRKTNYALLPPSFPVVRVHNAQVRHARATKKKEANHKNVIRTYLYVWLEKQLLLIGRDCFRHAQQMDLPQQHLTRQSLLLTCVTKEERSCGNNPFLTIYLKKYKYHE